MTYDKRREKRMNGIDDGVDDEGPSMLDVRITLVGPLVCLQLDIWIYLFEYILLSG